MKNKVEENPRVKALKKLIKDTRFLVGFGILSAIILSAVFAPILAPFSPSDMDITRRLCEPNAHHWLGCDLNGGDVLTSLIYGSRVSLYIGFLTVFLSVTVGVVLGLVSGYLGGWVDVLLMRLVDILLAFPGILLAMALSAVMGPSVHNIILAISATGWISSARLIRGQVLSVREWEFVLANRALGASHLRTMFFHILPSVLPPLIVHATFSLSGVIIIESSLSFLGLGPQGDVLTWGALLSQGKTVLTEAPNLTLAPGLAILVVVLTLNFMGDALRDVFDPKSVT